MNYSLHCKNSKRRRDAENPGVGESGRIQLIHFIVALTLPTNL